MTAKRVLVVDDASLMRAYYRQALERAGYVVDEALNGLEALEKILVQPFDLAIVDVNMPQMDGITFIKTLRGKDLPTSAVAVLVTSTEAKDRDILGARMAGANYYLTKPISQETLIEHVVLLCGAA
ncbi:response regulator [Tardiphaga alba]|jgi:two-component system chemotaxis response regulator CheY|uniref:Response regulator n=1 Tax=Tardiphaga alba TaxID=340268 RepID=A0ABX8AER7_9BRAD|nr:response regulator [Tardiphaga alba]QUS42024.1 response regulator [Tardiphaga alba]